MSSALVLGGGGVTGIAWELGLLAGLQEAGVDLGDADTVVGTSAGSVVGALVCGGAPLARLYAAQLEEPTGEVAAVLGRRTMAAYAVLALVPGSSRARRRRFGRASALAARRPGALPPERRVQVMRDRLGDVGWPERDLRITTVDARTGEFVVLDRHGDVDLVHAVAASCAVPLVWPPVPVGDRRFVDGGVRSGTNADVASGAERIVVVAPLPRALSRRTSIATQLARTGAPATAVVSPDADALTAIGPNVLDPARRADAARAGHAQAAAVAEEIRRVWSGASAP